MIYISKCKQCDKVRGACRDDDYLDATAEFVAYAVLNGEYLERCHASAFKGFGECTCPKTELRHEVIIAEKIED